jgi:hypothetical protein
MVHSGYLICRNGKVPCLGDDLLCIVNQHHAHAIGHIPAYRGASVLLGTVWDLELLEQATTSFEIRHGMSLAEDPEDKAELDQLVLPLLHRLPSNL